MANLTLTELATIENVLGEPAVREVLQARGVKLDDLGQVFELARKELSPLTKPQAEEMLQRLTRHFRDPVMPLTKFCKTMQTWAHCIQDSVQESTDYQHGQAYADHLGHILMDIEKSNLLARLFYGQEKLRTKKCPVHNGHWSGIEHDGNTCSHGCELTGWLKEG